MLNELNVNNGTNRVLIATHGGWIRSWLRCLKTTHEIQGLPEEINRPDNTAFTKLVLDIDIQTREIVSGKCLVFYNAEHLKDM